MWVAKDGRIRQELLPNGRYDEARGIKKSACQVDMKSAAIIDYWADTGFTILDLPDRRPHPARAHPV